MPHSPPPRSPPPKKKNYVQCAMSASLALNCSAWNASFIMGPEMSLTREEKHEMSRLLSLHSRACRQSCPQSLFQARVDLHQGTLCTESIWDFFDTSRRAQNRYHFEVMSSMPDFNNLTTR